MREIPELPPVPLETVALVESIALRHGPRIEAIRSLMQINEDVACEVLAEILLLIVKDERVSLDVARDAMHEIMAAWAATTTENDNA